jgi:hypothetical protein
MYSRNITRLQIPKSPKITRNKLGHGMKKSKKRKKETNVHHQATKKTSSKLPPDSKLALQTMTKTNSQHQKRRKATKST